MIDLDKSILLKELDLLLINHVFDRYQLLVIIVSSLYHDEGITSWMIIKQG